MMETEVLKSPGLSKRRSSHSELTQCVASYSFQHSGAHEGSIVIPAKTINDGPKIVESRIPVVLLLGPS